MAMFLFINASFLFLLCSPAVTNPLGKYLDRKTLEAADARIPKVRKAAVTITLQAADGAPIANARMTFRQTRHEFIFGNILFEFDQFAAAEENERFKQEFKRLFNLAVLPFYWSNYEPSPGEFPELKGLDEMIAWCESNEIIAKGHPLVWRNPSGYPEWLPEDREKVTELLRARVESTVAQYQGRIKIWDVVNEPTHLPRFGRQSVFDYVLDSFQRARAKDPHARLSINEYGIEGHDFGYGPYYRLVRKLLKRGAAIDLIGIQGREPRTDWVPAWKLWLTLTAYSRLGLPIHITELTVPSAELPITNSWKKGVWTEQDQADYLESYYKLCFSMPAVEGIIYWGLYDGTAWVKNGALLAPDWRRKPSYQRLDRLINQQWHSQGNAVTDRNGSFEFSGFYGQYQITLADTGQKFMVTSSKTGPNSFVLTAAR